MSNEILSAIGKANRYTMVGKKATINFKKPDPYSGDLDTTGTIVGLDQTGVTILFEDMSVSFYPWGVIFRVDI
jgi:hypothetical protein